jgi:hypothetical protein
VAGQRRRAVGAALLRLSQLDWLLVTRYVVVDTETRRCQTTGDLHLAPALAGPGAVNIADAKRFQLDDVVRIGPDVRLTTTPLK